MLEVGIIGCGNIGCGIGDKKIEDTHARAYAENPETEITVFCDTDLERAQKARLMWNKKAVVTTDYHLIGELDIISVCTPAETHAQIVCDLSSHAKGIYCEKPIALTLEDADRMIEVCDRHGTVLQVNHQRRFVIPTMRFSRDFIDTGTHAIDLLRQLFGEIETISKAEQDFRVSFTSGQYIKIQFINSQEHIFELDVTHTKERMINNGVQCLIDSLKLIRETPSSGEEARETLRWLLELKKLKEDTS